MAPPPVPSAIVVGVDGSRYAVDAALWAVDEAVSRDIPLRLLYAVSPCPRQAFDARRAAHDAATAEAAVRSALMAVESLDEPVKIEIEITQDRPVEALLKASRCAALIAVGALGVEHAQGKRVGSTVAGLGGRAACPVAVIRQTPPVGGAPGWIVADYAADRSGAKVLAVAVEEARLRRAPLKAISTWRAHYTDLHDGNAVAQNRRIAEAALERDLCAWRRRYPDVDIQAVAEPATTLNYLARYARQIQLVVVGQRHPDALDDLTGPPGRSILTDNNCSVLICDSDRSL